jgi:hypothetical protein
MGQIFISFNPRTMATKRPEVVQHLQGITRIQRLYLRHLSLEAAELPEVSHPCFLYLSLRVIAQLVLSEYGGFSNVFPSESTVPMRLLLDSPEEPGDLTQTEREALWV